MMSIPELILRYMREEDVNEVYELDRLSFPTPWPVSTYRHEIKNKNSYLYVLERYDRYVPPRAAPSMNLFQRLFGDASQPQQVNSDRLVGYSGMWHVADEVHLSTIAVHPEWRGLNLGELLVWNVIRHAFRLQASMVTLEVRISNQVAQKLYRKYGFVIVGRRKSYYQDNNEDAYLMTVTPLNTQYRSWVIDQGKNLVKQIKVTDLTRERPALT
jgi:ribosomal-protein-alanine N-acetyltransferase